MKKQSIISLFIFFFCSTLVGMDAVKLEQPSLKQHPLSTLIELANVEHSILESDDYEQHAKLAKTLARKLEKLQEMFLPKSIIFDTEYRKLAISPNGEYIAYITDQNDTKVLCVKDKHGQEKFQQQLLPTTVDHFNIFWGPNAEYIGLDWYETNRNFQIFSLNGELKLARNYERFAPSPNGNYMAILNEKNPSSSTPYLRVYTIHGKMVYESEIDKCSNNDKNIAWSPDESYLAFLSENKLKILKFSESGPQEYQMFPMPSEFFNFFQWSPNEKKIALSLYPLNNDRKYSYIILDLEAQRPKKLSLILDENDQYPRGCVWNPGSSAVAFFGDYFATIIKNGTFSNLTKPQYNKCFGCCHSAHGGPKWISDTCFIQVEGNNQLSRYTIDESSQIISSERLQCSEFSLSPNSQYIARINGSVIQRLNLNNLQQSETQPPEGKKVISTSWAADSQLVYFTEKEGTKGKKTYTLHNAIGTLLQRVKGLENPKLHSYSNFLITEPQTRQNNTILSPLDHKMIEFVQQRPSLKQALLYVHARPRLPFCPFLATNIAIAMLADHKNAIVRSKIGSNQQRRTGGFFL